jgi:predicted enzyme related to lactoylglutathione lyase
MTISSRTVDHAPALASLLLGSPDPQRLRDWYQQAFGATSNQFGFLDLGGFGVMPDQRADVAAENGEPGRFVLNLDVPDAKAAVAQVERAGTSWITPLEQRDAGWFATFTDPDGNYLQLIQLNESMDRDMRDANRADWQNTKPFSGIALTDVATAKTFYQDVLGLEVTEQHGSLAIWLDANTQVFGYPKPNHVPATHTVLNFPVDDIDDAVDSLVGHGVTMLRYDGMKQDEKCIMRAGGPLIAWFTDPSGNILSVLQES